MSERKRGSASNKQGLAADPDPPQRGRNRHRQRLALRGRSAGPRRRAGARVPSFTAELERLADWLGECGVDTVAMESTGVYWIPLFELLDARGFTVLLVNARHVKNVSGRKSDVLDCQWLQQLMSYGLLRGAFRPGERCVRAARARSPARDASCAARRAACSTCKRR